MKKLTKAEEQVMQILWNLKEGLVKDVIKEFPDPKPAYNTVSTVIRVLEKKEFVDHKAYGNTYVYFPTVNKADYAGVHFMDFMKEYFNDSLIKDFAGIGTRNLNSAGEKAIKEVIKWYTNKEDT